MFAIIAYIIQIYTNFNKFKKVEIMLPIYSIILLCPHLFCLTKQPLDKIKKLTLAPHASICLK